MATAPRGGLAPQSCADSSIVVAHKFRTLTHSPVGAGLLAMDVNDNAGCLNERVVQTLFASKPAPTGNRVFF